MQKGDVIYRQQAIDIVRNRVKRFTTACVLAVTEIENLPSAQPETHDKRTETHECDLISRRQAIGALNDEYHGMISDESMKIYQIINWISALPSAQPELLKHEAYIRGFEQGRTQGMIDSQGGKK